LFSLDVLLLNIGVGMDDAENLGVSDNNFVREGNLIRI
jgi:hypothetical protein